VTSSRVKNLLVVDDESLIRALLAQILRQRGYEVKTARNGIEALKTMREWKPDLVILDLNMPEMSGFEFLSIIRRRSLPMRVVVSSGSNVSADVPGGLMADAFHAKGEGIQTLVQTVETVAKIRLHLLEKRNAKARIPIWTEVCRHSDMVKSEEGSTYAMISCPECLRALFQVVDEENEKLRETQCPHCEAPVQFAVVQEMERQG
jgi:CheY-like chemotaxis protein